MIIMFVYMQLVLCVKYISARVTFVLEIVRKVYGLQMIEYMVLVTKYFATRITNEGFGWPSCYLKIVFQLYRLTTVS